jgi:imidazolonepropionase-like amidohydrolase
MHLTRLLFFASTLAACAALQAEDAVALHCGALLDPETDAVTRDAIVVTEGGLVKQILPATAAQIPSVAKRIDLSKGFCLPGLIDVHDHLTYDPSDSGYQSLGVSVPLSTVKGVRNARITLEAGFTTVRNVGAEGFSNVALRDGINAGDVLARAYLCRVHPLASPAAIAITICWRRSSTLRSSAWPMGRGKRARKCARLLSTAPI